MLRIFIAAMVVMPVLLLGGAEHVSAHPHVWVSVRSDIEMKDGQVHAIRHHWTFDEAFSAFASQGLDEDQDGTLSRKELQPLAQVNVESLSEYDFFSDFYPKGAAAPTETVFGEPRDYWLEPKDGRLILHFTLPVLKPLKADKPLQLDVYDPSFFVDFTFAEGKPVGLVGAEQGCSVALKKPETLDDETAGLLAQIPADQTEIPEDLMKITSTLANQAILTCE